jgi:hypothetical protein
MKKSIIGINCWIICRIDRHNTDDSYEIDLDANLSALTMWKIVGFLTARTELKINR